MEPARSTDRPDFCLSLTDVSSSLRSRARRLIASVATLGLVRTASGTGDLSQLSNALEESGFRVLRILSGPEAQAAGVTEADVLLLLRGTDSRLQHQFYREQLDVYIQARTSDQAEFTPRELPAEGFFTPARRIALLHAPLLELLPKVQAACTRDLVVGAVHPLHNRRLCAQLLSHLCRRTFLQAQQLHALRNEFGEKVAFLFAFRTHQQRWLRWPALLGVLLWLSRFVSERLPALLTPIFGLAVPVWASLLLEGWRARQRELASLWTVDAAEAEVVRPEFAGERSVGAFSAGQLQVNARRNRLLRRCVTIPVLGGQLLFLTAIITVLYAVWISIHESNMHRALKTLLVVLVSAAWGLLVEFFNWHVFHGLAWTLNHMENHRTTAEFEAQLVRKLFAFLFVDGFLWYFLLAFLHIPFGGRLRTLFGLRDDTFQQEFWMHALVTSIATLLIGTVPLSALWSVTPLVMKHRGAANGASPLDSPPASDAPYAPLGMANNGVEHATLAIDEPLTPDTPRGADGGAAIAPQGGAAADGAERGNLHGALREALAIRQRRAAGPAAPLGQGLTRVMSDDDVSDSDDERSHTWPRSVRLTSLLARKLPWPRHLHQRARRKHRTIMIAARRMAARMANADAIAEEARRPVYDPMLDLARVSLEFGYVLMFTVVWPLAPLCCLLISALEQRTAALRLTVGSQRPATGLRCDGLGTGDAWFHVLTLLAWVSVPINCGMIALATRQLDDARDALGVHGLQLPPFEKLLVAVIAEHVLLAAKLVISVSYADQPSDAGDVDEEHRRKYLLGVYGELHGVEQHSPHEQSSREVPASAPPGASSATTPTPPSPSGDEWRQRLDTLVQRPSVSLGGFGPSAAAASSEPRLLSVFPTAGSCGSGAAVTLRGERLGSAVSRGELTLLLTLPKPGRAVTVPATFVSERKVTCVLPPAPAAGVATIELLLPDGKGGGKGASAKGGGACSFQYCASCSASRLRPSSGPVVGGTPVRILGSGFVQTNELTVCIRLHSVERRVPAAFVSSSEVRFLAPSFSEAGDAKVMLSLNGQEYEQATETIFAYTAASVPCALQ